MTLPDVVHELIHDHWPTNDQGQIIRRDNGTPVTEMALLAQLHEQFTANRGTGPSNTGPRGLVSFHALNLWQEITRVTNEYWAGAGRPTLARTTLADRIQHWAEHGDQMACVDWAAKWCRQIRALDESRSGIIGRCPECGEAETVTVEDGEQTWRPAVTRVEGRAYASCAVCLREWIGLDQMRDLAAHVGEV